LNRDLIKFRDFVTNKLTWVQTLNVNNEDLLRKIHSYNQDCLIILRRIGVLNKKYEIIPRLEIKEVMEKYKDLRFQKTPQLINFLNQLKN